MSDVVLLGNKEQAKDLIGKCEGAYVDFLAQSPISKERFLRSLIQAIAENPKLAKCTQSSFLLATAHAALCGLEVSGPMGQASIIPFWNGRLRCNEAKFMPGYRGYVSLAHDNPRVAKFYARPVFDCDEFAVIQGTEERIHHIPNMERDNDARVIAAYSVIIYTDGTVDFEVLPARDLYEIEKFATSKLKDGQPSPYYGPFKDQMHMKAAIRRHAKRLPLGARFASAVEVENRQLEGGVYIPEEIANRLGGHLNRKELESSIEDKAISIPASTSNSEDDEQPPFDPDLAFADLCANYSLSSKELVEIAKKQKIEIGEKSTEEDFAKLETAVQEVQNA